MYTRAKAFLILLAFCSLTYGLSNTNADAGGGVTVSRVVADYSEQIEQLRAVSFAFESTYRRINSNNIRAIRRGEVQFGNDTLYLFMSQFGSDEKELSQYERLLRLGKSYFSCLDDKEESSQTVQGAVQVEAIGNKGVPQSNLGPWGILWGRVEVSPNRTLVLPEFLRGYQFKQEECSFQEDGNMMLKCVLNDEKIHMNLLFVRKEGRYCLKDFIITRDAEAWNPQSISYFRFTVDKFVPINGLFLSEEFSIEDRVPNGTFVRDGRELVSPGSESLNHYKLHDIKLSVSADKPSFKLRSQIPNYTQVLMLDAQHIEHIWLDGKVVPLTDELALARARGHGFIPGVHEPRFWFLIIGILLCLIGGGKMVYNYFKNKGEQ